MPRLDDKIAKEEERRERRDDLDHEHDGIVPEGAGIELAKRVGTGGPQNCRVGHRDQTSTITP